MTESYNKAVEFATEFLKKGIYQSRSSTCKVEPTEFIYMYGLKIEQHASEHPWCSTYYSYPKHAFKLLFMRSDTDKGAFDLASRLVTTKLLRGEDLSLEERVFAGMIVGGMKKCPAPEGKRLAENFAENVHLVFVTRTVKNMFNLHLTRNDENESKISACDAVSDALKNLGIHKSSLAIKNLLVHRSSKRVREVVDTATAFIEESRRTSGGASLLKDWVGDN